LFAVVLLACWPAQGLDVKRHNYDSWMGPLLHTSVNVTVTDFE
jgi:hypothetical protein